MRILVIAGNMVVWALVGVLLLSAPPEIPLYYSRVWGEAQVATKWEVLLIPLILNTGHLVAYLITTKLFTGDEVFTRIVRVFTIAQSVICIGILIRLLLLLT